MADLHAAVETLIGFNYLMKVKTVAKMPMFWYRPFF